MEKPCMKKSINEFHYTVETICYCIIYGYQHLYGGGNMEIRTKIYDCKNPEQNPIPRWMGYYGKTEKGSIELDLVQQFKQNPESFFPDFIQKK